MAATKAKSTTRKPAAKRRSAKAPAKRSPAGQPPAVGVKTVSDENATAGVKPEGTPAQVEVVARVTDPPEVPERVRAQVSAGVVEITIGGKTVALNRDQATELLRDVQRAVSVVL